MPVVVFLFSWVFILSSAASAETLEDRIKMLENAIQKQQETIQQQQKMLEELKEHSRKEKGPEKAAVPEAAPRDYRQEDRSREIYAKSASPVTPYSLTPQTSPGLMNPAIAVTLDTFYYDSSLSKEELEGRSIPGYTQPGDPFRKGFNLRSAEISLFAPVDPYFNFYATIPIEEEGLELEEVYFVTTGLPAGFQLKGGKFKSGFGRLNAFHPHAWDFVDAPLPYRAFLGEEGLIEKGVQFTYLPPLPIYTILGFEVLQGDNEILFGPDARSGPHAYTGFVKSSFDFAENHTLLLGGSVTGGKTRTESFAADTEFDGDSLLYGLEVTYKWKPSKRMSFTFQAEYLYRHQKGGLRDIPAALTDSFERNQDGLYLQALFQWERWRFGGRFDCLDLFKDDVIRAGEKISYDKRPYRGTGSLEYNPTEFSRLRLQYNYDKSARADKENHEVFLQLILAVGAHGAHPF
jgi:hypothetical protein